jgi:hypothetical protein
VQSGDESAFVVWNLNGPVPEKFPLLSGVPHDSLDVQFALTDEQWKTMPNHVCSLAELRDTERRYVKADVQPVCSCIKWAPKDLGESLLSAISMILQLMSELNSLSIDLMTRIGSVFAQYNRYLVVYHQYNSLSAGFAVCHNGNG